MQDMTDAKMAIVAERFRTLGEPARLRLLQALQAGPHTVTELVEATRLSQANASKHLALLLRTGFVAREKDGVTAVYSLADPDVFKLCDLVCSGVERHLEAAQRAWRP